MAQVFMFIPLMAPGEGPLGMVIIVLFWIGAGILVGAIGRGQSGLWLLGFAVSWATALVLITWRFSRSRSRSRKMAKDKPIVHETSWHELFYCNGCGNAFNPKTGQFVPLDRVRQLMH